MLRVRNHGEKTEQAHGDSLAVVQERREDDTCEHHHVLEVGANFLSASQVQQEGQGVDVRGSADKNGDLVIRVKLNKRASQRTSGQQT